MLEISIKKRKDKTSLIKVDSHDELCENQKITLNDGGKIDAEKAAAAIDNLSVLKMRKKWAESKRNQRNNKRSQDEAAFKNLGQFNKET